MTCALSDVARTVPGMKFFLMWTQGDAASGEQADIDAWAEYDGALRAAGVLVAGSACSRRARPPGSCARDWPASRVAQR